ncbi:UbiA family prenyltransferase [Natrialbaceae archaeon GCM10025810]|uniref:UbiA family prenyltransferase n=1 Tax=Halovalidus salilacus TaxID=3075124 RepID=UPI00360BC77F
MSGRTDFLHDGGVTPSVKATLRALVHSNVFISASASSVVATTAVLAALPLEPIPFFIVFSVTMFVYGLNRVTDLEEDERSVPDRAAFTRRYGRFWLALGVALYLAAVGIAVALDVPRAQYMCLPLAVAVLYSTAGLKRVFLLKNLLVGLAWAAIPLGVGVYYDALRTPEVLGVAAYVGAMITIAAVIFDIKDIEGDAAEGISTVPVRFGPRSTRIASQVANVAVAACVVGAVVGGFLPRRFLVLLVTNLYVGLYIPAARPDLGPLYYGFVVDGEHLVLAVAALSMDALA